MPTARCLAAALAAVLTFAESAGASYWDRRCHSIDGRVELQEGHIPPQVTVIPATSNDAAAALILRRGEYAATFGEATLIDLTESGCRGMAGQISVLHSRTTTRELVRIERLDGEPFPFSTPGLSEDGFSLETIMTCISTQSGMGLCPEEE